MQTPQNATKYWCSTLMQISKEHLKNQSSFSFSNDTQKYVQMYTQLQKKPASF